MSTSDAVEMTAQDIIPRLNKDTVTDLVLVSMLALPDSLPSHFHDTYTPIAAAGGQAQVVHLARLLATQMNAARIGKGYERMEALRKVGLVCMGMHLQECCWKMLMVLTTLFEQSNKQFMYFLLLLSKVAASQAEALSTVFISCDMVVMAMLIDTRPNFGTVNINSQLFWYTLSASQARLASARVSWLD